MWRGEVEERDVDTEGGGGRKEEGGWYVYIEN